MSRKFAWMVVRIGEGRDRLIVSEGAFLIQVDAQIAARKHNIAYPSCVSTSVARPVAIEVLENA